MACSKSRRGQESLDSASTNTSIPRKLSTRNLSTRGTFQHGLEVACPCRRPSRVQSCARLNQWGRCRHPQVAIYLDYRETPESEQGRRINAILGRLCSPLTTSLRASARASGSRTSPVPSCRAEAMPSRGRMVPASPRGSVRQSPRPGIRQRFQHCHTAIRWRCFFVTHEHMSSPG
jgi:hypothetical protein